MALSDDSTKTEALGFLCERFGKASDEAVKKWLILYGERNLEKH